MSTRNRLTALTAGLVVPESAVEAPRSMEGGEQSSGDQVETRFPSINPGSGGSRTGPGQMLAFRGQMLAFEGELTKLREQLAQHDGSLPTRKIDARSIGPSRWANRHPASFQTPEFIRLKADIEHAGGNVQPILVRAVEGAEVEFEIVFGHRRHRACLELNIPVLSAVWVGPLSEGELFASMDRENRERADLSPYEQGAMYQRALDEQLFPSQRRLAESLGVSHTWVRKAIAVAQLPPAVLESFRSPLEVQYRHAELLSAALEKDRRQILKRAEKLRGHNLTAAAVVAQLLEVKQKSASAAAVAIRVDGHARGTWRREEGGAVTIRLDGKGLSDERLEAILSLLSGELAGGDPGP